MRIDRLTKAALCLIVLVSLFLRVESTLPIVRDVCIVGGGIGGMSVATFLKDRGYNPLVLEKESVLGGCCNTVTFPQPDPTLAHAIDIGVIAFSNTTFLTQAGFGGWTIDSVAFLERFVGSNGLIPVPIPLLAPELDVDMTTGQIVTPPAINMTQLDDAITRYIAFLASYPFFTTMIDKPDPIPSELLVPFEDFIVANNFQVLAPLFRGITAGGTTNYSSLSVWEAVRMAVNIQGMLSLISSGPNVFSIKGGCIQIYNGMEAYLGSQNIWTSVNLQTSIRPPAGFDLPITLAGTRKVSIAGHTIEEPFVQLCEKLVVAIPQTLSALESFLDLDSTESSLFSKVKHFNYYVTSADVEGPLVDDAPHEFSIGNFQNNQLYGLPVAPALVNMFRGYPFGPATVGMTSVNPLPLDQMIAIAQTQLDRTPKSLFSSAVLSTANAQAHVFEPYFPSSELQHSPTAYTRLNNLQGRRNTYWSGSLLSTVSHTLIINWANTWVPAHFPAKNTHSG